MRWLFFVVVGMLAVATAAIKVTEPGAQTEVPVIYFGTGNNPFRIKDLEIFHQWLVDNGYTTQEGEPILEMRLDVVKGGSQKQVIQGVSGVAADIQQVTVPWYHKLGLIEDVTDSADSLGFDVSKTWPALKPLLTVDDRQYGFPANVSVHGFWINLDIFERLGMEPPPRRWDIATFEEIGRQFVARANVPGQPRHRYFVDNYGDPRFLRTLHRSFGTSEFNETMTRCTLADPGFVRVLELIYKWTFEDHLFPSTAEQQSFPAESGFTGVQMSLLNEGTFGMVIHGRSGLVRAREFEDPFRVGHSYFPYVEFPNCVITNRVVSLYSGSKHKREATLFLAFMASREYNEHIVRIADGLPPIPRYAKTALFNRPEEHPNEWGAHEPLVEAAETLAIATSISRFVPRATVDRIKGRMLERVMSDLATPQEAAREAQDRIEEEIRRTLKESAGLRRRYEELSRLQEQIDARRETGRPVPAEWIDNPFHRRYYATMGWLEEVASR